MDEMSLALEETRGPTSRAHRVSRLPLPGITGPFGLKPMCNDVPRQREIMWRAFVATDCYQPRNKDAVQPRFSKDPRAIFPKGLRKTAHSHRHGLLST